MLLFKVSVQGKEGLLRTLLNVCSGLNQQKGVDGSHHIGENVLIRLQTTTLSRSKLMYPVGVLHWIKLFEAVVQVVADRRDERRLHRDAARIFVVVDSNTIAGLHF